MWTIDRRFGITALAALLVASPAAAQENRGAAGSAAAGSGPAVNGGGAAAGGGSASGGGSVSGGGGSAPSGGSSGGGAVYTGGSSGRMNVGGQHGATGGSGTAVYRGGDRGRDGTTGTAVGRVESGRREAGASDGGSARGPAHARPRDGNEPVVGTAVPRGSVPAPRGSGTAVGGAGYGVYPWWLGGAGYYGGYYGGYYDPWYGGYPDTDPAVFGSSRFADEGSLRLKIKPRDAEVYVDGYFVGTVDDFDGVFQRLHIETGAHRIEVRAAGYEPLTFDVRITPDHGTTYQGELKRIQ